MGYRSEVRLVVALPTLPVIQEVMSVYAIDPRVQEHDLCAEWDVAVHSVAIPWGIDDDATARDIFLSGESDTEKFTFYTLTYCHSDIKWYDSDSFVQGIHFLPELCSTLFEERSDSAGFKGIDGIDYAYTFFELGEDVNDVKTDGHASSHRAGRIMKDFLDANQWISRDIVVDYDGTDVNLEFKNGRLVRTDLPTTHAIKKEN